MYEESDRELRIVQIAVELKGKAFDYKFVQLVLSFTYYDSFIDKEFNQRQLKIAKPQGRIDAKGKWKPTYDESCPICNKLTVGIRKHCMTRKHIATRVYTKMVDHLAETVLEKCEEILSKRYPTEEESKLFSLMSTFIVTPKLENF